MLYFIRNNFKNYKLFLCIFFMSRHYIFKLMRKFDTLNKERKFILNQVDEVNTELVKELNEINIQLLEVNSELDKFGIHMIHIL